MNIINMIYPVNFVNPEILSKARECYGFLFGVAVPGSFTAGGRTFG